MSANTQEIIANVDRLNSYMDKHGYAAVVVQSGTNFTYLSGISYSGTLARYLDLTDSPRCMLVIWPRHGDPISVLGQTAISLAERGSWIQRIVAYDDYIESPYDLMAGALEEMGLHRDTVGFEKTYVSAARWEEIQKRLPDMKMSDCTDMMTRVRWIKTPGEIRLLKEAADILDDVYLEVFPTIRDGDTEREVHSRIVKGCIQKGAQWAHGMLNSSTNTVVYGGEGDIVFQKGDVVRNDYVSYYRGYPGHQSRTAVLGKPSGEQKRMYNLVRDMYRATVDQCRAGAKASAVHEFAVRRIEEHGYSEYMALAGHGVGPWWHQQEPYIARNWPQELEEGMVLAMEPRIAYWHLQDLILVTKEGPEFLSDRFNTDEMFVIS